MLSVLYIPCILYSFSHKSKNALHEQVSIDLGQSYDENSIDVRFVRAPCLYVTVVFSLLAVKRKQAVRTQKSIFGVFIGRMCGLVGVYKVKPDDAQ